MRPHPKYASSDIHQGAWATCDACGFIWNQPQLDWNKEYAGFSLVNKRTLVCPRCNDVPNETLRAIVLPPDTDPVIYARPEQYGVDEGLFGVFTGSVAGAILTVTGVTSGGVGTGAQLSGAGVTAGTIVGKQLSGNPPNQPGGIGTYAVTPSQSVPSTALTATPGF